MRTHEHERLPVLGNSGQLWQELLTEASSKPWLMRLVGKRGTALYLRFRAAYERLARLRPSQLRRLQRKLGLGLAGAALLLALNGGPVHGAPTNNIVVDAGGVCTLAEAITSANNDSAAGNGCTDGSGSDTITLETDVNLSSALPAIASAITIEGGGHTIAGNNSFGILTVNTGANLTLNSATISRGSAGFSGGGMFNGGTALVQNSTISGNSAYSSGGGIGNNGTLTISNSTVSNNWATYSGGGIHNTGTLTVQDSTISGNSVDSLNGGGILNVGTLTVFNSTISDNSAIYSSGGGIHNFGTLTVSAGTISGNSAYGDGGGIHNSGILTVSAGTISENSANKNGGGIYAHADSSTEILKSTISGNSADTNSSYFNNGGGIDNRGTLTVQNSTLSRNSARNGGGIDNRGTLTVQESSFSDNWADSYGGGIHNTGPLTLQNSTLSGNSADVGGGGISNGGAELVLVRNSTLSGNSVQYSGGGIINHGTLIVQNSTLSGNSAYVMGGGIYNLDTLTVSNSTISGNSATRDGGGIGVLEVGDNLSSIENSLISGNMATRAGNEIFIGHRVNVDNGGFNLFGHNGETSEDAFHGFTPGANDITATSDGTGPTALASILDINLAANDTNVMAGAPLGSPVLSHALAAGSPAIDAVPSSDCSAPPLDKDQRGKDRNANGDGVASANECDIGAFEFLQPSIWLPSIMR